MEKSKRIAFTGVILPPIDRNGSGVWPTIRDYLEKGKQDVKRKLPWLKTETYESESEWHVNPFIEKIT